MPAKTRVRIGWELATLEAALEGARILTDATRHGGLETEHDDRAALTSSEIIDTFMIGLSNRTLGYRIPDKAWHAGRKIRQRLQRIGILKNTGHELFRGSIVIPVFDEHGRVVQLHGRKVARTIRERSTDHTQLPGGPRGVWNRSALASSPVILCQSLIDGLTVWCAGFKNVTAVAGYDALTVEHLAAFKQNAVRKVLVASCVRRKSPSRSWSATSGGCFITARRTASRSACRRNTTRGLRVLVWVISLGDWRRIRLLSGFAGFGRALESRARFRDVDSTEAPPLGCVSLPRLSTGHDGRWCLR